MSLNSLLDKIKMEKHYFKFTHAERNKEDENKLKKYIFLHDKKKSFSIYLKMNLKVKISVLV